MDNSLNIHISETLFVFRHLAVNSQIKPRAEIAADNSAKKYPVSPCSGTKIKDTTKKTKTWIRVYEKMNTTRFRENATLPTTPIRQTKVDEIIAIFAAPLKVIYAWPKKTLTISGSRACVAAPDTKTNSHTYLKLSNVVRTKSG